MSGWEAAAAYQKERLEAAERERVARWEASVGKKRPAPTGPARSLESSFNTSLQIRPPTAGSSSMSYQGVQGIHPGSDTIHVIALALENHISMSIVAYVQLSVWF